MRGFLGKIFLCMLLVPVLARGAGLLLEATLTDKRPQSTRTLAMVMPAMAGLAAAAYAHGEQSGGNTGWNPGGAAAVTAALAASPGLINLLPPSAHCNDPRPNSLVQPLPGSGGLCLGAVPPPRALVLGLVPASWWFLVPLLELLCCGVVSFGLARYLAQPILRTRTAAMAFAAGDLAARAMAPPPNPVSRLLGSRQDEAADLEREFNHMAARVAAMIAAQQRFMGDVSHEIRSPLARLALIVGLARRGASPALLPRLDHMESELDHVTRLVRELLMLATLQGSTRPPARDLVDVPHLLSTIIDDLTFEFQPRAPCIRIIGAPGRVVVQGDGALLRRAFDNVLRNALFYTAPSAVEPALAGPGHPVADQAAVELLIDCDSSWMRLVVRDHGPGVPETALPQLFEPFFRVDQARARHTGGAGLGLAITRRAVELHGGHVQAANAFPHGLVVRIDLPIAA